MMSQKSRFLAAFLGASSIAGVLLLSGCKQLTNTPSQNSTSTRLPGFNGSNGAAQDSNGSTANGAQLAVHFSPNGGCTDAIVNEIDNARQSIWVQAYSFTSTPIAKALVNAARRGVKVTAVLDKSNATARYTGATFLVNMSIPTYTDNKHAIAHNKVMVIDDATVITGSFNFTKAAEQSNAENCLIIKNAPAIVQAYKSNIQAHIAHSIPYEGRATVSGVADNNNTDTEGSDASLSDTTTGSHRHRRKRSRTSTSIFGL